MKSELKIGNVKLKNPFILAPMHGVNCPAFRRICFDNGAGLVYTYMLHPERYLHDRSYVLDNYLDLDKKEHPITLQLIGSNKNNMLKAALELQERVDIIDINLGCPDKAELKRKSGAYFLNHPELIKDLLKPLVEELSVPLTVKIRSGWKNNINAVEVAELAESIGVKAISIHARTVEEGYSGKADWNVIAKVKEKVSIPVIGNGDASKPELVKAMIEKTKCDFVMIGRGAIGRPYIFKQCIDYFEKGSYAKKNNPKKAFFEFMKYFEKQNRQNFSELRTHAMWFMNNVRGAGKIRRDLARAKTEREIVDIFNTLK